VQLRPFRSDDRSAIERILRSGDTFTGEETAVALQLLGAEGYEVVVAEDGAVAGYACHGRAWFSDGAWELYWLAVAPESRGRGIGGALLAAVEDAAAAAGGRFALVETASKESYAPARRFYERCGYAEIARVPDFYRVGDDKIVYRKLL
jgi:ribosomal protein S18 acetylase RimI-like enzyme